MRMACIIVLGTVWQGVVLGGAHGFCCCAQGGVGERLERLRFASATRTKLGNNGYLMICFFLSFMCVFVCSLPGGRETTGLFLVVRSVFILMSRFMQKDTSRSESWV